jgi:hypothetical protein
MQVIHDWMVLPVVLHAIVSDKDPKPRKCGNCKLDKPNFEFHNWYLCDIKLRTIFVIRDKHDDLDYVRKPKKKRKKPVK